MKSINRLTGTSLTRMIKKVDRLFESKAALFHGKPLSSESEWLKEMNRYSRCERNYLPQLPVPDSNNGRSFEQKIFILKVYSKAKKDRENFEEAQAKRSNKIFKQILRDNGIEELSPELAEKIMLNLAEIDASEEEWEDNPAYTVGSDNWHPE